MSSVAGWVTHGNSCCWQCMRLNVVCSVCCYLVLNVCELCSRHMLLLMWLLSHQLLYQITPSPISHSVSQSRAAALHHRQEQSGDQHAVCESPFFLHALTLYFTLLLPLFTCRWQKQKLAPKFSWPYHTLVGRFVLSLSLSPAIAFLSVHLLMLFFIAFSFFAISLSVKKRLSSKWRSLQPASSEQLQMTHSALPGWITTPLNTHSVHLRETGKKKMTHGGSVARKMFS